MEEEIRHGESKFRRKKIFVVMIKLSEPNLCYYYSGQFGSKCIWVDFNVSVLGFNLEGMTGYHKKGKPLLSSFSVWGIKKQNS